MRYYNIDQINSDSKGNKYRLPLILTLASILITCVLWGASIYITQTNVSNAEDADKAAISNKISKIPHDNLLGSSLREITVHEVTEGETIPAYSMLQIRNMDVSKPSGVTVADLKLVTRGNFVGLEEAFLKAEKDYGINCLFVMAIGANESAYGTRCFRPNNMFGFGRHGFSSKEECIDKVSSTLANKYLNPRGSLYHGKTIDGVHRSYAASSAWDDHVAKNMVNFYKKISAHHNEAMEALK